MSVSAITLARPYGRAAFEAARDAGELEAWHGKLAFAAALAADARVRAVLGNPRLGTAELEALFLPQGEAKGSTFSGFVATLIDNRRLALLPEIAQIFAELKREHERVLRVTVRAAVAPDAAQAQALEGALARRFGGRRIELDVVIDPAVIGGAIIDAGEVVIDGSVRGRLARLAQALTA